MFGHTLILIYRGRNSYPLELKDVAILLVVLIVQAFPFSIFIRDKNTNKKTIQGLSLLSVMISFYAE